MCCNFQTVRSFAGFKTLVVIQAGTYGNKLSQDILLFNRGGNWKSSMPKTFFLPTRMIELAKCLCITRVPNVSLNIPPEAAGPPIVIPNNFVCSAVFVSMKPCTAKQSDICGCAIVNKLSHLVRLYLVLQCLYFIFQPEHVSIYYSYHLEHSQ